MALSCLARRQMLFAAFTLIIGCLALPTAARSAGRAECFSIPSAILHHPVNYCAVLPPTYDQEKTRRYPILYLLHGLGDNEQMLVRSGGLNLVDDLWDNHELGEMLIVTPAAGASFYINSQDGKRRYEDFFLQEFLPAIEKRYRILPGRDSRAIAGISMGGYGALHLAFSHPTRFSSVGAHSAALLDRVPTLAAQDPRRLAGVRILGNTFGSPPDAAFWKKNDPLAIARTANLAGLKIYFDCGDEDDYGFNSGAVALDKLLTSRHIPHEFHLYPGRHEWTYFAEHLPALLKFHFAVFDAAMKRAKLK